MTPQETDQEIARGRRIARRLAKAVRYAYNEIEHSRHYGYDYQRTEAVLRTLHEALTTYHRYRYEEATTDA